MKTNKTAVCTTALIAINVIIFFLFSILGKETDALFLLEHGAMYEPYILERHEYYRLLTSMFLHFGIDHLVNNMIMLGALGFYLESAVGSVRFLLIYFIGGIGGTVLSLAVNHSSGMPAISAGASGAVFALMGALLCAVIQKRGLFGRISRRGMIVMVVLSLYFGFTSTGVDNAAHLGGLLCGFLLQMILRFPSVKKAKTVT